MRAFVVLIAAVAALLSVPTARAADGRIVESLDAGWRFLPQDTPGAEREDFDDAAWRVLDVPHDWSIEGDYADTHPTGAMAGWLPSGIGWYRRSIEAPETWKGRAVAVEFEGVYMDSAVWLNGVRVGGRPYGYISFACDLAPHLRPGRNVLAVRVDNSLEPSARWYHGCGIYGHVRLVAADPVRVVPGGIFVQTPAVDPQAATVRIATEVTNGSPAAAAIEVRHEIVGPDGRGVGRATATARIGAGAAGQLTQDLRIERPSLWDPAKPSLHTLKTVVLRDGRPADEVTTTFGIRSLRFDARGGFFLNGRPVKLQGVCEHQGGSPVGAAMPEALLQRRLQQLKDMGCNAIRAAHNPQLPAFYDLCDRMGLLVMDEIFDGWHKKAAQDYGARFFEAWWRRDVADWVRRDRNHPCVIFWSIGNETGRADTHGIAPLIRALDATRPTTGGAVVEGVDVAGFNGGIVPTDAVLEDFHRENPGRPIVITEEPHTFQTRGFYRTVNEMFRPMDPLPDYAAPEVFAGGHPAYRSSYDNCGRRLSARGSWRRTASRPWVIGEFRWTGFDYLGESAWAGTESLAREFNFGVLDLAGFPKDAYFFYQSVWTDPPMVHLLPHWTHPGLEGVKIPVVAYANADQVELFQDGQSLGRKPRSELFECVWQVPYRPGELKAVAWRDDRAVAETVRRTAGPPAAVRLTTDNAALKPDRTDLALVTVAVHDDRGTLVPRADSRIDLALSGPARWLGGENGDPVDVTPQRSTARRVFHGLARGFYAGIDGADGPVEVAALGLLGPAHFPDRAGIVIAFQRVALRGAAPAGAVEIRYTTDGTPPTPSSPVYAAPVELDRTMTVRAAAFRDGKPLVTSEGVFTKGAPPAAAVAPRSSADMGTAEDPSQAKKKPRKKNR